MEKLINTIQLGDCLEVMRRMPDKSIDLILTDPPYGIGIDGQPKKGGQTKHRRKAHAFKGWDKAPPSKEVFDEMQRVAKHRIIFGANYFPHLLDAGYRGWIIWDKGQYGLNQSDCEIAFSDFDKATRIFLYNRTELLKDGTIHPTQKPLALWSRIIENYSEPTDLILDPFSGSGVTAIAAHRLDRRFICIEKDPDYHAASVERYEKEKSQIRFNFSPREDAAQASLWS